MLHQTILGVYQTQHTGCGTYNNMFNVYIKIIGQGLRNHFQIYYFLQLSFFLLSTKMSKPIYIMLYLLYVFLCILYMFSHCKKHQYIKDADRIACQCQCFDNWDIHISSILLIIQGSGSLGSVFSAKMPITGQLSQLPVYLI